MQQKQNLYRRLREQSDILKKSDIVAILHKDYEIKLSEIASELGLHPSYISHLLRLQNIPKIIIDGYYGKMISPTHLLIISRLKSKEEIIDCYKVILEKNLTTSQTERLVRKIRYDVEESEDLVDEGKNEKNEIELRDILGAKVRILQTKVRTKISIEKRGSTLETSEFIELVTKKLKNIDNKSEQEEELRVLD